MLVIWNTLLLPKEQLELCAVDPRVKFWPASWMKSLGYNEAMPIEWWISFSSQRSGLIWLMRHPGSSRVVYS